MLIVAPAMFTTLPRLDSISLGLTRLPPAASTSSAPSGWRFSASLATGAAVSISGPIAFVGLVVPHLVRLLVGSDHRLVLPASALFGAVFLIGCDLVARTAFAPIELPVGIITAVIGGPFFLWLLVRSSR
jgi:iron complex transport system permease protein